MKKKLVLLILAISLITNIFVLPAMAVTYNDVSADAYYAKSVDALTTYGIVSGYNGSYRPYDNVTRAEFAKIIALISGLEDESFSNAGYKKFEDVAIEHWATGYINTVADNKIILGYPDGTYRPENNITYAEALTVVLRALGYSTAELGDNWPYAYMLKANALGLSTGLNVSENETITRAVLAVIVDRALQLEINKTTTKLISKLEISVLEDTFIIATHKEDKNLSADEIRTESGIYQLANNNLYITTPSQGDLVLNKDGKIINFVETEKFTREYTTVEGIINNEVYFANGKSSTELGITNSTGVYNDGAISTFNGFKSNIKEGAGVSIVIDKYGSVKFLLFGNADYTEATVVYSNIYNALETVGVSREQINNSKVIKDGYASSLDNIDIYDVVYYLVENSTIYVYSDKVSGVYNKAYPNKASVTSVDISSNILELETQVAVNKLGEKSGSYKLGSRVTALLGKDGKVVDVVDLSSADKSNYCILLSCSTENSDELHEKGEQYKYINVINGEGHTLKLKTKGNYTEKIGLIGKLTFDDDKNVVFTPLSSVKTISGAIDKNKRQIGNHWLTSDCVIIERTFAPDTHTGTAVAQVIDLEDINASELRGAQVIHAVISGDFEDVSLIFVENVTNDQYRYGILTGMSGGSNMMSTRGSYEVYSNGSTQVYSADFYKKITTGSAVALELNGNALAGIKTLVSVETLAKIVAADSTRIKTANDIYKLSDDVQVIKKTSSGYQGISKNKLEDYVGAFASLYADSSVKAGGLIRIVLIKD